METATTLYRDIQITEENTKYDAAVKKLLKSARRKLCGNSERKIGIL